MSATASLLFEATGVSSVIPITVVSSGNVYTQGNTVTTDILVFNQSGTKVATITSVPNYCFGFCVDYSNNKIYCAGGDGPFVSINISTNVLTSYNTNNTGLISVAIGPDGYVYAVTNSGYTIRKINPADGTFTVFFSGTVSQISSGGGIFSGCAFDSNGYLYCNTIAGGYIYKFNITNSTLIGLFAYENSTYGNARASTYDPINRMFYTCTVGGAVYRTDKYGNSYLYSTISGGSSYGIFYNKIDSTIYLSASHAGGVSRIYKLPPYVPPTGITYFLNINNLLNYYPFNTDLLNYASYNSPVNDTTTNLVSISNATTVLSDGTGSLSFPGITNNWLKINKLNFAATGLTISVWVKYNYTTGGGGTKRIFDFGNGGGADGLLISFFSGNEMECYVTGASYLAQIVITDYTWHNYCLIIDTSNNARFYIDGAIQTFKLNRTGPALTVMPVTLRTSKDLLSNFIGNSNWSPNESIYGYMNNFLIFNRAFTADEIAATSNINNNVILSFKNPVPYSISNEKLFCYYKFGADYLNYASGTGVSDASASGVSIASESLLLPGTSAQGVKLPTIKFGAFGLTIAFWLKCVTLPTNWARVFDFATSAATYADNFFLGFPTGSGMQIKFYATSLGTTSTVYDLSYRLVNTNWHHYVLTISNIGDVLFYVDGVKITGFSYTGYPTLAPFVNNYIGKSPVSTDGYLNAYLNQFFVFNRVISAEEISGLSNILNNVVAVTTAFTSDSYSLSPTNLVYGTSSNITYSYSNPYLVTNAQYSLYNENTLVSTKTYIGIIKSGDPISSSAVDDSGNVWSYTGAGSLLIVPNNLAGGTNTYLALPSNPGIVWSRVRYYNGFIYLAAVSGWMGTLGLFTVVNPYTKTIVYSDASNIYADFDFGNDGYMYAVSGIWRTNPRGDAWRVDKINLQTYAKTTVINGTVTTFGSNSTDSALISISFDADDNMYIGTQTTYFSKWSKTGVQLMAPMQMVDPVWGGSSYVGAFFDCHKASNTLYINNASYLIAANMNTFKLRVVINVPTDYTQIHPSVDNRDGGRIYHRGYRIDLNPSPTIQFTGYLNNIGTVSFQVRDASGTVLSSSQLSASIPVDYPCFLQGSKILRLNVETDEEEYIAVEKLRQGDLIRTATCGYKAVAYIGRGKLYRPADDPNPKNRLYRFQAKGGRHPPLFITGEHCLLYPEKDISVDKRQEVREFMGDDYITEVYHRVPACLDDSGEAYKGKGPVTIWHFALEHNNWYNNHAVYANGILVETCSIDFLVNRTSMELV